jgi:hypothetical protein
MRKKRRGGPSDPQDLTLRKIAERVRTAKQAGEDYGIDPAIGQLATSDDIRIVHDLNRHNRVLHARRSSAFDLVTLTEAQHRASQRYFTDWCVSAGVGQGAIVQLDAVAADRSHPGIAPGQNVTQRMVDAGGRLTDVHARIGLGSARLLQGLVEPLVMRGEIRPWRYVAQLLTGETERHAQAAAVRQACENLYLAYEAIDAEKARARRFAGGSVAA